MTDDRRPVDRDGNPQRVPKPSRDGLRWAKPTCAQRDRQHVLEARDLRFAYRRGGPDVLGGIDLKLYAGELVAVLGPNGSGKSTLLRLLLGLLPPRTGHITIDGRDLAAFTVRELARLVSYVPQQPSSSFAFTARDIVLMGRLSHTGFLGLAGPKDRAVADEAMKMTHTLAFGERTFDELSGGEGQCVMIARALAQEPSIMLLDEPTSHLDLGNQLLIHRMMRRVAHDWPMAVLTVSHDINLAARHADRLLFMRGGALVATGRPAEILTPALVRDVFDVDVELVPVPDGEPPQIRVRGP